MDQNIDSGRLTTARGERDGGGATEGLEENVEFDVKIGVFSMKTNDCIVFYKGNPYQTENPERKKTFFSNL